MAIADLIAELHSRFELGPTEFRITQEEIEGWSQAAALTPRDIVDELAAQLAVGFYDRELPFDFCDAVVCKVVGFVYFGFLSKGEWPELFWKVYLAFDEGEFYHEGKIDEDPVEIYTRPLIATIVEQLRANKSGAPL